MAMEMLGAQGAIVVGIDGSAAAESAARWAAADAAAHHLPVHLVVALGGFSPVMASEWPAQTFYEGIDLKGRQALESAADAVGSIAPHTQVTTAVTNQPAAPTLIDLSKLARKIVLGRSGLGGFTGMLLGSVPVGVTSRAHSPVVVVRGRSLLNGPIVVGVDGSASSEPAVSAALEQASRMHVPLVALHAVERRSTVVAEGTAERVAELASQCAPQVECHAVTTDQPARGSLMSWSGRAQLVVVGARGRGAVRGALLGSTSQALLHHAACPVLVAHDGTSDRPRRTASSHLADP